MNMFTIGADPELFLKNLEGKYISAVGLIGGSKETPKIISPAGHAVQEDNVSVEFNIPPSSNLTSFLEHMDFVMDYLKVQAKTLNLSFAEYIAAASFDEDQLQTPEALVFGCEPDFNAYTLEPNPKPNANDKNLRSCGGHVHVGTTLDSVKIVKAMDIFLGVPSVFMDNDTKRRELYGKAGAFRFKPYGVEYRTLSNFWIWSKELQQWVYEQTIKAVNLIADGHLNNTDDYVTTLINHNLTGKTKHDYFRRIAEYYPHMSCLSMA